MEKKLSDLELQQVNGGFSQNNADEIMSIADRFQDLAQNYGAPESVMSELINHADAIASLCGTYDSGAIRGKLDETRAFIQSTIPGALGEFDDLYNEICALL